MLSQTDQAAGRVRLAVSFGCAVGRTSPLCQAVRNPLRNSSSVGIGLAGGSDRNDRSAHMHAQMLSGHQAEAAIRPI
jgi:hypothetical protein